MALVDYCGVTFFGFAHTACAFDGSALVVAFTAVVAGCVSEVPVRR